MHTRTQAELVMTPKKKAPVQTRALSSLQPGERGVIVKTPIEKERLAEMGLIRGEEVELLKVAPWGDPVILQVLGAPIIVRRSDLAGIDVT